MLAPTESAPSRPSPLLLSSAFLAAELGWVVMAADDPCEAAFAYGHPTGPRNYYRARYYDPKVGRFISEDPIGFAGGVNFYEYAFSNPANWVDPYGLDVLVALREGAHGYGHIGIGVNQSTDTVGFYSSDPGLDVLVGKSVPGVVRPDESKVIDSIIIKTTPEQDQIIQSLIDWTTRNPPQYNLDTNNCAIQARGILAAGGVRVPNETKYPKDFFKDLEKIYGPSKR